MRRSCNGIDAVDEILQRSGMRAQCAQQERPGTRVGDSGAGELIDPEAPPVERGVSGRVLLDGAGDEVLSGEAGAAEGVVDALAGKGLHDARGIAYIEYPIAQRPEGGASERCDGAPLLLDGYAEPL